MIAFVFVVAVPLSSGKIIVGDNVNFCFSDGSGFTNPGEYDKIQRVDNKWFFDDSEFESAEPEGNLDLVAIGIVSFVLSIVLLCLVYLFHNRREEGV